MFKLFKNKNKNKTESREEIINKIEQNELIHFYPDIDDYITIPINDFNLNNINLGFIHMDKDNVSVRNICQYGEKLSIVCEDISRIKCDAVVNAARTSLLGGGGVDGAIHCAAGPDLLKECKTLNGCEYGQAKITDGYRMYVKKIIHTVGPKYKGGKHNEAEILKNAYKNAFDLAVANDLKTVAFPAISCGNYGYPVDEGVKIAISVAMEYLEKYPDMHFIFVVNAFCFNEIVKILNGECE